jgi:hypothetical protein
MQQVKSGHLAPAQGGSVTPQNAVIPVRPVHAMNQCAGLLELDQAKAKRTTSAIPFAETRHLTRLAIFREALPKLTALCQS